MEENKKPNLGQILMDTAVTGIMSAAGTAAAISIYEKISVNDYEGYFNNLLDPITLGVSLGAMGIMFGYGLYKTYFTTYLSLEEEKKESEK